MGVTAAILRDALAAVDAVGGQMRSLDELAAGADGALRQAPPGLTADGVASWLATQVQESAYLRTTREYGSGQRYAPFVGRTFEQITWRENYAAFGGWCRGRGLLADPGAFVNTPGALEDYRWAWLGGLWYFEVNGLWRHANAGNHWAVSQGVNRGVDAIGTDKAPNGWRERLAMFDALRRAGAALLPGGLPYIKEGDVSAAVYRLLAWLNTRPGLPRVNNGTMPPSRMGPQGMAAATEWQRQNGIPTAPPFGWGDRSWQKAREQGFPG